MSWTGRVELFKGRGTKSNIAVAHADWYDGTNLICTYSEPVDSVQDKNIFKTNAENYRDNFLSRTSRNETLGSQLTTFLNQ